MYSNGAGVTQDYTQAFKWFLYAAEHDEPSEKITTSAQQQLGLMYLEGRGVPANFAKSFKWLLKSAEGGA